MVSARAAVPWLGAFLAMALPAHAAELLDPLVATVLHAPAPVRGDDGLTRLIYELHVTSMVARPLTVTSVEASDDAGRLQLIEGAELAGSFAPFGISRRDWERRARADRLTLDPGMSGFIYLSVTLPEARAARGPLQHAVVVESDVDGETESRLIELLPVPLSSRKAIRIGPPVRGGPWLASNGPSNTSGHRRRAIPLHGRLTVFQRYAIDYLKLDSEGRRFVGDWRENRSYLTHGEEAIAVADAAVVAVKDGIVENVPEELPTRDALSLDTVNGNAVMLDLGDGHYAIYAHLLPGSLKVKAGDRVRRGDALGRIGNTGNSIHPHLHFQLADSAKTLSGEGLPYVHERFEWAGKCPDGYRRETPPCAIGPRETRTDAIPLEESIVFFP